MAELYSQYTSGDQFPAGTIVGSALGASGLNPLVDRLNSISTDNSLLTGSIVSGTALEIYASGGDVGRAIVSKNFISTTTNQITNIGSEEIDSITIGTTAGQGVFVTADLTVDWNDDAESFYFSLQKGGVDVEEADMQVDSATGEVGTQSRGSIHYLDTNPGTGSVTYTLRGEGPGANTDVEDVRLTAFTI